MAMKTRTLNELRQEKTYGYKAPLTHNQKSAEARKESLNKVHNKLWGEDYYKDEEQPKGYTEIDIETTKDLIISNLKNHFYDLIFQEVCEQMEKHEVFQSETYFTDQGFEEFQDTWLEFYHEHHGDILGAIMKNFTN